MQGGRYTTLILGRSPALWLALVAALLNALVIVAGVKLSAEQIAALNIAAAAIVGVVANESDPTTAPTFSTQTTAPTMTAQGSATAASGASGASVTDGPGPSSPTTPAG